jgi:bacteriorhodopsin
MYVLTIPVTGINILLNQLLIFEFIVQLIEIIFYYWMSNNLSSVKNITTIRYYDWMITTPTMLVTLIIYLIYLKLDSKLYMNSQSNNDYNHDNDKDDPKKNNYNAWKLFMDNKFVIINVLLLNWLMLLFGYFGEVKYLSINTSVILGFIPFLIYFYLIYTEFAQFSSYGITLFLYFFLVWGIYGIAALFPYKIKNICYNFLDLFSKNFFGLFLSYLLFFK